MVTDLSSFDGQVWHPAELHFDHDLDHDLDRTLAIGDR